MEHWSLWSLKKKNGTTNKIIAHEETLLELKNRDSVQHVWEIHSSSVEIKRGIQSASFGFDSKI